MAALIVVPLEVEPLPVVPPEPCPASSLRDELFRELSLRGPGSSLVFPARGSCFFVVLEDFFDEFDEFDEFELDELDDSGLGPGTE